MRKPQRERVLQDYHIKLLVANANSIDSGHILATMKAKVMPLRPFLESLLVAMAILIYNLPLLCYSFPTILPLDKHTDASSRLPHSFLFVLCAPHTLCYDWCNCCCHWHSLFSMLCRHRQTTVPNKGACQREFLSLCP